MSDPKAFLSVVLHDVVDERAKLDPDGMTTSDLVAFFEYLVSNGWHAITLDEIDRAGRGDTRLPEKSILITMDDANESDYTRVYPLLLATKMPAVIAAPVGWMVRGQAPGGEPELTWAQAREMQDSGLVEFASHGYDLHGAIRANPQANQLPAFAFRMFDPVRGYEGDDEYRGRVEADLQQSITVMTRELGRAPRAIAWPYGRYTQSAVEIATAVGFRFALTFDPEPALAGRPLAIGRFALSTGSLLPPLVEQLQAGDMLPRVRRFVRLRPSSLWRPESGRDRAPARRGDRAHPDPGRHCGRDRRGRAGTGRTSCRMVPHIDRYRSAPTSTCASRGNFRRERVSGCGGGCPRQRSIWTTPN